MYKFLILMLFVLVVIVLPNCLLAQVRVDFKPRTSISSPNRTIYNIKGDFLFTGNTNLTRLDYGDDLMNDGMMIFVDVDDHIETVNSSSANVDFSNENGADISCTNILFAGLYWTGRGPTNLTFNVFKNGNSFALDKRKVKFKGPGQQGYVDIEASANGIHYPPNLDSDLGMFVGYAEVTDYVREWGVGEYHVGNIALIEGTNWHYGGWGLVVVYENPNMKSRDITVFDGYAFVRGRGAASYEIPVSGFSAGNSGEVNLKLGVMAGEGDVGADGDFFAIQKLDDPNEMVYLSHRLNDKSNFFNSSILTGGNLRNPNLRNNTGMDISVFEVPNENNDVIGNNQTATNFFYGSTHDVYAIFNITMAIDANEVAVIPFNELKSINGKEPIEQVPSIGPGDIVGMQLSLKNKGETEVINGSIEIPIPIGMELYVVDIEYFTDFDIPIDYFVDTEKGENGVLVWDVGKLPISEDPEKILATLKYELRATVECKELVKICSNAIQISGLFKGTNGLTNTEINDIPFVTSYSEVNKCFNQPIIDPLLFHFETRDFLHASCNWKDGEEIMVCASDENLVDYQLITQNFPEWVSFFYINPENEVVKIEKDEMFPLKGERTTFYAGFENKNACSISFSLIQTNLIIKEDLIKLEGCEEERLFTLSAKASGGIEPYSYKWNDLNGTGNSTLEGVPFGTYTVTVTDAAGCSSFLEFLIPDQDLVLSLNENNSVLDLGCLEGSGIIKIEVDGPNFPLNLLVTGEKFGQTVYEEHLIIEAKGETVISNLPSGTYDLTLIDQGGCSREKEVNIVIIENPDLEVVFTIDADSNQISGHLFQDTEINFFSNSNSSELTYIWDFGDGNTSIEEHPTHIYEKSGEFLVTLVVKDKFKCEALYAASVYINSFFFRMPNAFNPSHQNENSHFFPVFSSLTEIKFWVFNRWGELLFFTEDLNSIGWDGRYNQKEMPNGIYVYQVYYKSSENEEGKKSGSFLLFR